MCRRSVRDAQGQDQSMPDCRPSHVLINHYTSSKGLLWHRDIYANDGDGDHPIVNLSVGASCEFGVEMGLFGEKRTIRLRSGDAVLFGGPCRYVQHAVTCIDLDERPSWMADAYRLSFTFREATSVLGQEFEVPALRRVRGLVRADAARVASGPASRLPSGLRVQMSAWMAVVKTFSAVAHDVARRV